MDAIKLLKNQHAEVEKLLRELVEIGPGSVRRRKQAFERAADLLAVHATLEEKLFYPAAHVEASEERLLEALELHLAVKRVIADLMTLDAEDPTYGAKTRLLADLVLKHQDDEEEGIFPAAADLLGERRLLEIGREMNELMVDLETSSPRQEVPLQIDRAASLDADSHWQGIIAASGE